MSVKFESIISDGKTTKVATGEEARKAFSAAIRGRNFPPMTPEERYELLLDLFESHLECDQIMLRRMKAALKDDDIGQIKHLAQLWIDSELAPRPRKKVRP